MEQVDKAGILSGDEVKIRAGILAFLRDGRTALVEDGTHADGWRGRFVGEYTGGSILLPYRETGQLIDDGVIEIADDYSLRLTAKAGA